MNTDKNMQVIITVLCDGTGSLRETLANDRKLSEFGLDVVKEKVKGRAPGWTKVHGSGSERGAANVE